MKDFGEIDEFLYRKKNDSEEDIEESDEDFD